jgi:hypothetical protein
MTKTNKQQADFQPQRGCITQPRVGAQRLPWVMMARLFSQPQRGCASSSQPFQGWKSFSGISQGSRSASTLGFVAQPLRGWAKRGTYVPEGQPTIARRFNAGVAAAIPQVPKGRLTSRIRFQSSLRDSVNLLSAPALKRRAILTSSLREKVPANFDCIPTRNLELGTRNHPFTPLFPLASAGGFD